MSRIIEIAVMLLGGLSIFTVCFVGFVAMSGKPMSEVAVIGGLFPEPEAGGAAEEAGEHASEAELEPEPEHDLGDAQVLDASLGVLGAWTLPSPYSTGELRTLSEEIKKRLRGLEEKESVLREREHAVADREEDLAERGQTIEKLRAELEVFAQELTEREQGLARRELAVSDGENARWVEIARVLAGLEDQDAGKRLLEYPPADGARILAALGDETRASEILNQIQGPRWKELVDAYTAERARAPAPKRKK